MIAHDRTRLIGQLGCQAEWTHLDGWSKTAATLRDSVAAAGVYGPLNETPPSGVYYRGYRPPDNVLARKTC
jgi:hypothetical protein